MARTPDATHGPSIVPTLPEDAHSLEATSVYSSPVSATPSHGRGFPNPIGLGITGCGVEPAFDHLAGYHNPAAFSVSPALSSQIATTNPLYDMSLKIDNFSRPSYDIYTGLSDTSSPLSLYGSQAMGPSSSFGSPVEVGAGQTTFPGQVPGYWAPVPCPDATTPPEISPTSTTHTMEGQWNGQYFPEACVGLNAPALPMTNGLPVVDTSFNLSTPAGESDDGQSGVFSTGASAVPNPPSTTSAEGAIRTPPRVLENTPDSPPGQKQRAKKIFQCPTCPIRFTRRSNCVEHQKKHIPGFKKAFFCDECDKTFGRNADLKRHKETVSAPSQGEAQAGHLLSHDLGPSQDSQTRMSLV